MNIINKSALRRHILLRAQSLRTHKFTRVSHEALATLEMNLRRQADELIRSHPAKGSTIKP
jgi:hypothetical protein